MLITIRLTSNIHLYTLFLFAFFNSIAFANGAIKPPIQLATSFNKEKQDNYIIKEYWISEKLDGIRGYWDGQSLFTKQGNLIKTPLWFTEHWPQTPLDGELWISQQQFENTLSCVKQYNKKNTCWYSIKFMIFDLPNHKGKFSERVSVMRQLIKEINNENIQMIPQHKVNSMKAMYQRLEGVVKLHGEGLMLHHENANYHSGRVKHLLKVKKKYDAEAIVIEYLPGKGKYLGMLGAIKVKTMTALYLK